MNRAAIDLLATSLERTLAATSEGVFVPGILRSIVVASLTSVLLGPGAAAQARTPTWTHGATCYEVFVRSFADADGDGIGDLRGLTARLDYINDGNPHSRHSLGARCIWLMPVAASPSYHGYDVTDYYRVNPQYGSNADFQRFMSAAHRRGIRVLVDLVLNHTSDQHPHFVEALHDTTSPYRAWYRWSPTKPGELNPWRQSNWHRSPIRDEWYYAFFSDHMPDLNYATPAVREEAKRIARFWLVEMNVDGFRLDAVPYLVEEPGHLVHSAATHALLREFGAYVRRVKPSAYTVGEVSDSTAPMLTYYPDQLDANFAFEVADSIIQGVRRGSAAGILPAVLRVQDAVAPDRLAFFLDNHDQPRVMSDLGGDRGKARVAAFILLTLPGMPFVYYGDEIGMSGTKPDERLRTPMQWSSAPGNGFTSGRAWEAAQPDSQSVTVGQQDADSASLLAHYRRLIHLRATTPALGSGRLVPLRTSDAAVMAFLRRDGSRIALAMVNVGDRPLSGVQLSSALASLPAGHWRLRSLLGGEDASDLVVDRDGRVSHYVPLPSLSPERGYLFELSPTKIR
ncbi:MAG TPA: alpha-amylase family glycosyl hydrolase [Gemmatimonadaceae bacterium]|nr:alpha-amylase family glycosyl hydrolase [Gemmatimonadaceae bacterium]